MILAPYGPMPGVFPYEALRTFAGKGTYLCPHDPYYNQRGETGYYHDTQLGQPVPTGLPPKMVREWVNRARRRERWARFKQKLGLGQSVPTDAELSQYVREYTPYHFGWLATTDGRFIQSPGWHPGPSPAGPAAPINYGVSVYPQHGLGAIAVPSFHRPRVKGVGEASADDVVATLVEHQKKMFQLSVITTIAVTASALIGIFRTGSLLKEDARRRASGG